MFFDVLLSEQGAKFLFIQFWVVVRRVIFGLGRHMIKIKAVFGHMSWGFRRSLGGATRVRRIRVDFE